MIGNLFAKIWLILKTTRNVILNLIFFTLLVIFITNLFSDDGEIKVPNNAALVLDLKGQLVEQKTEVDPVEVFFAEAMEQEQDNPEVLMSDLLFAIEQAKDDERINTLVLKLDRLQRSGLSKLQEVGDALLDFKLSGKKIIAMGDGYAQDQYYLASHADEIWLNKDGWVMIEGFGRYRMYIKSALEKLAVKQHVFRVGTFKSAVEPYIRDDMSPAAKEANQLWLNDLWAEYKKDVAEQRGFDTTNFDETVQDLIQKLTAVDGKTSDYAIENQWVDNLMTREEMHGALVKLVGKKQDTNDFNAITYNDYLKANKLPTGFENPYTDKVAIVVAKGTILDGNQKAGTIGGDSTARLLRKARLDDSVKAVVLRVDSPGGSAFASEIIRQEIEQLKAAGKPVVASMASLAASGGYWISASADKIIASPTTITGSIGVFGMVMTFEDSLGKLGVYTDGVGTTELAGFSVTRPLSDDIGQLIQLSINRVYKEFLTLVSESRGLTIEEVDKVAQGRVWSGLQAKELGLVDELGDLDDAIVSAAELAGVENYDTKVVEKELSPMEIFLKEALGQTAQVIYEPHASISAGPLSKLLKQIQSEIKALDQFNDPNGIYSFCLTCEIN